MNLERRRPLCDMRLMCTDIKGDVCIYVTDGFDIDLVLISVTVSPHSTLELERI